MLTQTHRCTDTLLLRDCMSKDAQMFVVACNRENAGRYACIHTRACIHAGVCTHTYVYLPIPALPEADSLECVCQPHDRKKLVPKMNACNKETSERHACKLTCVSIYTCVYVHIPALSEADVEEFCW